MRHSATISDELLSAYIDRQMSEAELRRVEKALAVEPALQQRLETLQATVTLLQNAPSLVAPRAFVLSENQALAAGARVKGVQQPGFWERWLPRLTPVATAIIAVLFIVSFVAVAPAPASVEYNAKSVIMMENVTGAPAIAREAPAETGQEVQSRDIGQVAPRVAQPRSAVTKETADETADEEVAAAAAPSPQFDAALELKVSPSAPQPVSANLSTPFQRQRVPWITWLLGLLLILFIFLTWRVTITRSRRK